MYKEDVIGQNITNIYMYFPFPDKSPSLVVGSWLVVLLQDQGYLKYKVILSQYEGLPQGFCV